MKYESALKKDGGEFVRERSRKYRADHAETYRAHNKRHHDKNREQLVQKQRENYQKTKLGSPWKLCVDSALRRAREKDLPFDLTYEWAEARWTGRCEITNIPFQFGVWRGPHTRAATIDKIDPKLGYLQSNCRIILQAVNALKGTLSDEEMLETAQAIVDFFSSE